MEKIIKYYKDDLFIEIMSMSYDELRMYKTYILDRKGKRKWALYYRNQRIYVMENP